jgi:hypothetical protein
MEKITIFNVFVFCLCRTPLRAATSPRAMNSGLARPVVLSTSVHDNA